MTTSLPSFDVSVFLDQLEAGNLIGAIGDPIAADVALVPFALFWVWVQSPTQLRAPCSTSRTLIP